MEDPEAKALACAGHGKGPHIMTEPDANELDASVWWEWCQHVALSQQPEYPDVCEDDLVHDITQALMWGMNEPSAIKELARISGIEPPPGRLSE